MHTDDLVLNNLERLMCHKTKLNFHMTIVLIVFELNNGFTGAEKVGYHITQGF